MPKDYFHIFIATKSIDQSVKFFNQIYNEFGNQLESAELIPKIALDICIKKGFLKQSFFQTKHETFLLCKFALFEEANKLDGIIDAAAPIIVADFIKLLRLIVFFILLPIL